MSETERLRNEMEDWVSHADGRALFIKELDAIIAAARQEGRSDALTEAAEGCTTYCESVTETLRSVLKEDDSERTVKTIDKTCTIIAVSFRELASQFMLNRALKSTEPQEQCVYCGGSGNQVTHVCGRCRGTGKQGKENGNG